MNDDYTFDHYLEQEQQAYNELEELKAGRLAKKMTCFWVARSGRVVLEWIRTPIAESGTCHPK